MSSSGEEAAEASKTTETECSTDPQPPSVASTASSIATAVQSDSVNPDAAAADASAPDAAAAPPDASEKAEDSGTPKANPTGSRPSSTSTDATQTASSAATTDATAKGKNEKDSDSEGDGAEEILEESPCKRWSKRREQVKQRDVPGIDGAYLAMDNETGNEVVWNEVQFSERKNFRAQEEKINQVFDNLQRLVHANLVKFHKYWTDAKSEKPRIIFITEYMSAGCMSRCLQRTRKSGSNPSVKAWKKWITQILSALNYLHSCNPPIVHGNITCDTVFIQGNGLIKIGCVAPTAIHHHVKTFRENIKNMHYIAPEYDLSTPEADIYSFGICALEMAVVGGLASCGSSAAVANGVANATEKTAEKAAEKAEKTEKESSAEKPAEKMDEKVAEKVEKTVTVASENTHITQEMIQKGLESLDDPMQRMFIESCLDPDPKSRPTARQLLLHTVLFEVISLKLLAAHRLVDSSLHENLSEDNLRISEPQRIAAASKLKDMSYSDVPGFQVSLDKFLEDVAQGIYPLTAFAPLAHPPPLKLTTDSSSPGLVDCAATGNATGSVAAAPETMTTSATAPNITGNAPSEAAPPPAAPSKKPSEGATDQVNGFSAGASSNGGASATPAAEAPPPVAGAPPGTASPPPGETRSVINMKATITDSTSLTLLFQLDDDMNRQLTTEISEADTAEKLVEELLLHGFIAEHDSERICGELAKLLAPTPPSSIHNGDVEELPESECADDAAELNGEPENCSEPAEKRPESPSLPSIGNAVPPDSVIEVKEEAKT
ncbi:hypothetical protein QR680_008592 [Steinernema hermaphroditum]|uniref:Protein kinase domain-containing protein n=1 Tax=Steinernema hermaphroditum TaxID=289476 RepID=A0AA39IH60_9BILA|nr:hypothetical protein QR680_008592 [Steinernema hermaphroditum]